MSHVSCQGCDTDVPDEDLGRFCLRFQEESFDFCSERCLAEFQQDPQRYPEAEEGNGQ